MTGYLLFFVPLAILAFFESAKFKEEYVNYVLKLLWIPTIVVTFIFIGFRYKVGLDWFQYNEFMDHTESLGQVLSGPDNSPIFSDAPFEIGYKWLCLIIKTIGIGFPGFVAIISAYNLFCLTKFIKRYIPDYRYMFMLILYSINIFREFDILRQSLAFYTLLFAIPQINKSFFKYLLICLAASLFHNSALIFIPIYGIFKLRFSRRLVLLTSFLYILNFIVPFKILSTISRILLLIPTSSSFFIEKFLSYIELFPTNVHFNFLALTNIFMLFSMWLFYDEMVKEDKKYNNLFMMFIAYIFVVIFFSQVEEINGRFAYYFTVESAFILAIMSQCYSKFNRIFYNTCLLGIACIKFVSPLQYEASYLTYFPYNNYLLIDDAEDRRIMNNFYKAQDKTKEFYDNQAVGK
ncbi:EpsG family protein [Mucilaginibacter sp. HC2]|uniref:EpsG family protein n=1 Tax=Mucilaginibacter inviolabilis TaxID=2714892 RepID=UPI00140890CF|nr:EpsG family protein [Mucilaginibacter inviolabilis]NHA04454.1 EpsG family protein [Mucilaginibacter inviolabilis]